MRIASLVPAATDVLFAVGLGDQYLSTTHPTTIPDGESERPRLTASLVQTGDMRSEEIDRAVSEAADAGKALYAVDAEVWAEVEPEIVVAQELCDVCAVTPNELGEAIETSRVDVGVLDYSPSTLEDVFEAIRTLGSWLGADAAATELVDGMRTRIDRVKNALAGIEAGHWVPDMVSLAGGGDVAGMSGEPSHRMRWPDVAELEPEVVVLAPCGFDLDRTLDEVVTLDLSAHLLGTPARRESRVFAVDADGYFSRPGPRLAEGVEVLAYLLHPDRYSDPGVPWCRIRL